MKEVKGTAKKSQIFAELGDEKRLKIVALLSVQKMTVQEIVEEIRTSQPNISQHLRKLHAAGVVKSKRDGQKVFYSLQKNRLKRELEEVISVLNGGSKKKETQKQLSI